MIYPPHPQRVVDFVDDQRHVVHHVTPLHLLITNQQTHPIFSLSTTTSPLSLFLLSNVLHCTMVLQLLSFLSLYLHSTMVPQSSILGLKRGQWGINHYSTYRGYYMHLWDVNLWQVQVSQVQV